MIKPLTIKEWIIRKKMEEIEFGWLGETNFQKHIKALFKYRDYLMRVCPSSKKIIESLKAKFWYK